MHAHRRENLNTKFCIYNLLPDGRSLTDTQAMTDTDRVHAEEEDVSGRRKKNESQTTHVNITHVKYNPRKK